MSKKFIIKLICFSIPFIVYVIYINTKVDAALIIDNKAKKMANILMSNQNLALSNIGNNCGILQKTLVEKKYKKNIKPKEIILFGTSRAGIINQDYFKQKSFYNCNIPGANILDFMALYQVYKKNKQLPKHLILSIDPFTFHTKIDTLINKETVHMSLLNAPLPINKDLEEDYLDFLKSMNLPIDKEATKKNVSKWKWYFDPSYYQYNFGFINKPTIVSTSFSKLPGYTIIHKDGSYNINDIKYLDSNVIAKKVNRYIEKDIDKFFNAADTSKIYIKYFEYLMRQCKKDNVEPIVLFLPVNPIAFDKSIYNNPVAIEQKIKSICTQNNIKTLGTFNPHFFGVHTTSKNFTDAYHPTKIVMDNIFMQFKNVIDSL